MKVLTKQNIGICRLCLKEKKLLSKSHIIPDFMYSQLFKSDNFIQKIPRQNPLGKFNPGKMVPSGEYEGGILCLECDGKLIGGVYENYASRALYGKTPYRDDYPQVRTVCDTSGTVFISKCNNLDYTKFKLFLLSVLWRASISSRQFFSEVNLGSHEDRIRKMILTQNPGSVEEYPIQMMTYVKDKSAPIDLILQPWQFKAKRTNHQICIFVMTGIFYYFYIGDPAESPGNDILETTIRPTNELDVFHTPPGFAQKIIYRNLGIPTP